MVWSLTAPATPSSTGERGLLVPVRVADCQPPGLLRDLIYIDLVDLEEAEAAARLRMV